LHFLDNFCNDFCFLELFYYKSRHTIPFLSSVTDKRPAVLQPGHWRSRLINPWHSLYSGKRHSVLQLCRPTCIMYSIITTEFAKYREAGKICDLFLTPKCSKSFSFRRFRPLIPTGGSALWIFAGGSAPMHPLQARASAVATWRRRWSSVLINLNMGSLRYLAYLKIS